MFKLSTHVLLLCVSAFPSVVLATGEKESISSDALANSESDKSFFIKGALSPLGLTAGMGIVNASGDGWTLEAAADSYVVGGFGSITIGPRWFLTRSFYVRTGAGYGMEDVSPHVVYSGPGVLLSCGNEWDWGRFVIGGDWIGLGYGALKPDDTEHSVKHRFFHGPKFVLGYRF